MLTLKAIYGMIYSALLWYDLFSKKISVLGFIINSYERCIANKFINEHQCTIGWFVEDNKVSHMYENFNSMIADKIEGGIGNLPLTTG